MMGLEQLSKLGVGIRSNCGGLELEASEEIRLKRRQLQDLLAHERGGYATRSPSR